MKYQYYFKSLIAVTTYYLLLSLGACITPADIDPANVEPTLVVEGFIDTDFGPHDIRITRLGRFAGVTDGGEITTVDGAFVSIEDDLGNVTSLVRSTVIRKEIFNEPPGCVPILAFVNIQTAYQTPSNFRGEVGRTYTLVINTGGDTYRSQPQTILATPAIDDLTLEFVDMPGVDAFSGTSGVNIIAKWDDPVGDDFYSWRINGIYRISTPDPGSDNPDSCCLFDPTDGGETECWIQERNISGNVAALSDRFFDGTTASEKVGFIEDDGLRFSSIEVPGNKQYYVEVEQFRISFDAFDFFDRISVLATIDGEIFDPPPLSIRGNIFNDNDQNERVIGFFGAFDVQKEEIFVSRDLLQFTKAFPQICGDCRVRTGAQVEIPEPFK